jgi:hypothetical protein
LPVNPNAKPYHYRHISGRRNGKVADKVFFYLFLLSLQSDLQLSVSVGLWATQPHNEFVLDQAYRTSKDVYLIFGANKAGEFYGFAK